tara:strand:+ start:2289 stop:2438 length:150 start_codon:yes stop_codon:yes gene_type:complete
MKKNHTTIIIRNPDNKNSFLVVATSDKTKNQVKISGREIGRKKMIIFEL